ncbi:helix-turn-helix domain-containing protein [Yeosuana marina]|uniref:helix-turn-helix domain-containing protein n=1 Tax=Yeosuana marina TaxID=1565536 RepID=UPI001422723F|nr:helix-turn-helix transcriptional regulator [Yeosuana marina]
MSIDAEKLKSYKILFGLNLKKIRESKGLSQFELASAINDLTSNSEFEKTTISRIENGRTNITLTTAIKLSLALSIELKELFSVKISD